MTLAHCYHRTVALPISIRHFSITIIIQYGLLRIHARTISIPYLIDKHAQVKDLTFEKHAKEYTSRSGIASHEVILAATGACLSFQLIFSLN